MPVTPEHQSPVDKQDCIDTWRKAGRISVPARSGHIVEVIIVNLYETTAGNGIPLDLLIEAQTNLNEPVKQFGVVFSQNQPDKSNTPYRSYGGRRASLG